MYNSLALVYREKVLRFSIRAYDQRDDALAGSERIDSGVAHSSRMGAAGERSVSAHRCGRIAWLGRRIRQRQNNVVAGADGFASAWGTGQRRSIASDGSVCEKFDGAERAGVARRAWRRNRHGLSGTDDLAESRDAHRRTNRRNNTRASTKAWSRRSETQGGRFSAARGGPRTRGPRGTVSASALRRPAPTRDDCHGAGRGTAIADRGRTNDSPRRHCAKANPRSAGSPPPRVAARPPFYHARSRRCGASSRARGGDVRRTHHRRRARAKCIGKTAASIHARIVEGVTNSQAWHAHSNSRRGAAAYRAAARLRVRTPL